MTTKNFEKALEFLFPSEGGYVNHTYDRGGATNMGVTQKTYNAYRRRKDLPSEDIRNITRDEAVNIYYEDYWQPSGANEISDPNTAVAIFDTAVLHGPATAKSFYRRSNGDLNEFLNIRQQSYDDIIEKNPTQKVFYSGWNNRVNNLRNSIAAGKFTEPSPENIEDPYLKSLVDTIMAKYIGDDKIFSRDDIKNMTNEEFMHNEKRIFEQMTNGTLKNAKPDQR